MREILRYTNFSMNRYTIGIISFVILTTAWYFIFSADREIVNYPPKEGPIVAFGDSLVSGVGAEEGEDFISLLSVKLGKLIINMGVPGNTTADGIVRVGEVLEQKPSVVILLLGGNDYLRRIPKEQTFQNLRQIIRTLQNDGILVVLLGVRGGVLADGFASDFETVAEEMGTVYVENVLDGIFGKPELMADGIHPNEKGHALIAEKVYGEMREVVE